MPEPQSPRSRWTRSRVQRLREIWEIHARISGQALYIDGANKLSDAARSCGDGCRLLRCVGRAQGLCDQVHAANHFVGLIELYSMPAVAHAV